MRAAQFASVHAVPLRLRYEVIGAMNLFLVDRATLTAEELALAQALADIATIWLLQERAVHEQQVLAEQLQGPSPAEPSSNRPRAFSPSATS